MPLETVLLKVPQYVRVENLDTIVMTQDGRLEDGNRAIDLTKERFFGFNQLMATHCPQFSLHIDLAMLQGFLNNFNPIVLCVKAFQLPLGKLVQLIE